MDLAILHMLALLQQSMEDDLEWSTISQEATRQLLGASGFLARNVAMPDWLETGLVSYFEIPPAHLHLGFGLARGDKLRVLQTFAKEDKSFKSADVLTGLATNRYFRPGKKDVEPGDNLLLGQSASWALIYYLGLDLGLGRRMEYPSHYARLMNEFPSPYMAFQPDMLGDVLQHAPST